ncbi:hypothetical protein BDN70DRAFT_901609 [Pholiota conissans]|uniref:Uncharacterized protein n=1 Tax=Pholiota conissans TaxID=109636 RepID=A0A9P6CLW8_9AGAR|nr:hypothetical protein BDN70DRAFT_901609 [Pholiota conissans]
MCILSTSYVPILHFRPTMSHGMAILSIQDSRWLGRKNNGYETEQGRSREIEENNMKRENWRETRFEMDDTEAYRKKRRNSDKWAGDGQEADKKKAVEIDEIRGQLFATQPQQARTAFYSLCTASMAGAPREELAGP